MTKTYVLIHGGWHGGWCWKHVAARLRANGHDVHTPTLTGLGERSHLMSLVEGPDTHVTDVVNTIRWNELDDVILVGHSYGGMVITGVASAMPDKIAHLVYLDAFVPQKSGDAAHSMGDPERVAQILAGKLPDGTLPPSGFPRWSDNPDTIAWLQKLTTPHPAVCFDNGVTLSGREKEIARRSYILAGKNRPSHFARTYDRCAAEGGWALHELPSMHDVMLDMPDDLTAILLDA